MILKRTLYLILTIESFKSSSNITLIIKNIIILKRNAINSLIRVININNNFDNDKNRKNDDNNNNNDNDKFKDKKNNNGKNDKSNNKKRRCKNRNFIDFSDNQKKIIIVFTIEINNSFSR